LLGCSQRVQEIKTTPGVDKNLLLQRIENYIISGEQKLKENNLRIARWNFNQAVDLLINLPQLDQNLTVDINEYLKKMSEIEFCYLQENSPNLAPEENDALIDEIVATPLYSPKVEEVLDLQKKVAEQAQQFEFPIVINDQVASFLRAFQTSRFQRIQRSLNRSWQYIDYFQETMRKYGLPVELAYLPLIESGFVINARSRAKATGIWQFMAGTARLWGLKVDWFVDERLDPFLSADAAARFLKSLYETFGDWHLALAAYNAGPGKISRALTRISENDFFKLNKTRLIRNETRNYVPAFIASLLIFRNPTEYGFDFQPEDSWFKNTKIVTIPSPVSLEEVARLLNIPYQKLKALNPHLLREYTPPDVSNYWLRIPLESDEKQLANLKLIPRFKLQYNYHIVRKGETLYSISRRYGVSVERIKKANNLKSNILRTGMRLIIPRG